MNQIITWTGIYCYSILLESIKIVLVFLELIGIRFTRWHLKERFSIPPLLKKSNNTTSMWLHGASLGEVKILYKFFHILCNKYPDTIYVFTAVSEAGVNYLRNHKTENMCAIGYLPIDTVFLIQKLIKKYSITQLWIAETEIWPSMLWTCFKNRVSVGFINARMEKKSYSLYCLFKFFLKPLFSKIDVILAQNDTYALRFEFLGASKDSIHVVGNIKSHLVISIPTHEKKQSIREQLFIHSNEVVITIGCLHPDEALIIKETIDIVRSKGFCWKWIIVPRHIHKAAEIRDTFDTTIISVTSPHIPTEWSICLIEAFGLLEDMYMLADAAILGGTFNSIGGHNIWEAVQYAIPVFFGTDFHTQEESYKEIIDAGLGFSVRTSKELASSILDIFINNSKGTSMVRNNFINSHKHSLVSIEKYIP